MALDTMTQEGAENSQDTVSDEDVEIATRMGIKLLMDGGAIQQIETAIRQSEDPGQVVGQFLAQLIAQLAEQLQGQIDLDPRVFLAKGGFLENILNFIEDQLGLPEEFSEQVWGEVVEMIKALAMDPQDKRPAPPGAQPGTPVGGMPDGTGL